MEEGAKVGLSTERIWREKLNRGGCQCVHVGEKTVMVCSEVDRLFIALYLELQFLESLRISSLSCLYSDVV